MTDRVVPERPWRRLPADLADALRSELESTIAAVAQSVSAVPEFSRIEDSKFERDLHRAVRSAVERFLDLVGTDQAALPPQVREIFVGLGAAEAREERSPEVVLAALRTSGRGLLRAAASVLAARRAVEPDELLDLADAVTAYVDAVVAASTDGYAAQVREQAGETDRRRRLLGELLLRGNVAETTILTAASDVGWGPLGDVVPVLLPPEHARDARFRYAADGVVVDREHDAVLLVREGRRSGRGQLVEALRGRSAVVGPSLPWSRVPEGVRLAELTSTQVQGQRSDTADPVFADDHLLVLALRGEPAALGVLSDRRLAPFARLAPGLRNRLLQTLHSWLLHWGSRGDVAAELFIHPQTVSYRVRRIRDLLGDDLDDPVARSELLLVLSDRTAPAAPAG